MQQGPFGDQQPPQGWQQGPYPPQGQPFPSEQYPTQQGQSYQQPPQWASQQGQWQQPPQFLPPPSPPKKKSRKGWIITGIVIAVLILGGIVSNALGGNSTNASSSTPSQSVTTNSPTQAPPTTQPSPTPTTQSAQYPPKTENDLHGLAAQGDASAIHEFHSESVGLTGICPQPKREVTVDASVTGKQLAEDLLAYFYAQQLGNPCGSVVFAYHNTSDSGNGYTAGRILFDVNDASGQTNTDPNGQNLTYKLTLDIGDYASGQEYVVNY